MSKIFEALKKTGGEMADLALPMVDGEVSPAAEEVELAQPLGQEDFAELQTAEYWHSTALAEEPLPSVQAEPHVAQDGGIRVVPVRLRADSPVLPFQPGQSRVGEQYRIARTKIIQHPDQPRLIAISSAGSGDGKTVSAINLAGALALKSDAQVILVEADLRRPTMASLLGLPSQPGLSEYLAGTHDLDDVITRIEQFPNLCFLPSGRSGVNPTELLDSKRWTAVCEEFRQRARFVIFDTPPIGTVADYDLIESRCDGVVFVVRPDRTNRKQCLEALATVAQGKLIGVLMNYVTDWFLSKTKGYDYYRATAEA